MGETKLEAMKDLVGALSHLPIGEEVSVQFVRNGTSHETKLRLKEAPEQIAERRR